MLPLLNITLVLPQRGCYWKLRKLLNFWWGNHLQVEHFSAMFGRGYTSTGDLRRAWREAECWHHASLHRAEHQKHTETGGCGATRASNLWINRDVKIKSGFNGKNRNFNNEAHRLYLPLKDWAVDEDVTIQRKQVRTEPIRWNTHGPDSVESERNSCCW